jgi:hypothetical protein
VASCPPLPSHPPPLPQRVPHRVATSASPFSGRGVRFVARAHVCAQSHTQHITHTHTHCLFASQAVFHSTICLVIITRTRKGGGRGVHSQHHHHTSSRIANRLCCVSPPVFTPSMLRVASPHARAFTLSLPTSSEERDNTRTHTRNLSRSHTAHEYALTNAHTSTRSSQHAIHTRFLCRPSS